MELEPEKREIIDRMLNAFDDAEAEQVNLAYLAEMTDCLVILDKVELFQL